MKYVGDLSKQDAEVLSAYGRMAARILEFGPGASTMIFSQVTKFPIDTIETDPTWPRRVKRAAVMLKIPMDQVSWYEWGDVTGLLKEARHYDLIFIDGLSQLRAEFAQLTWPMLDVSGHMLFHDTRHPKHARTALRTAEEHFLETCGVSLNVRESNISVIRKCKPLEKVDWNKVEGRPLWALNLEDPGPHLLGSDYREEECGVW